MVVPNANRIPPRELPLQKPSAANAFIPRALVRSTQSSPSHVWMPPNATSGTSQNRRGDKLCVKQHSSIPQPVMDLPVQALMDVEAKVTQVEIEVNAMIEDLHVAAAVFSAQMSAHRSLVEACRRLQANERTIPHEAND